MKWWLKLVAVRKIIATLVAPYVRFIDVIGASIAARLGPVYAGWKQLPKFRRHFIGNCVIGIVIAVLLHVMHNSSLISQTENWAMDSMMFLNQETRRMAMGASQNKPLPLSFIDIDEDTYRTWEEPFHIPRDKLLQLIQFAADGGAKAIIVDIELAKASNNDVDLLAFLQQYNENLPPLFLLRNFYPKSKFTNQQDFQVRPSMLDKFVVANNIYWVQPMFKRSTYDQVVRYWHLLALGCLNDRPVVIPSFQLLLDAYLNASDGLQTITNQLNELSPQSCADIEQAENSLSGELFYADKKIKLDREAHQRIGERIIYTLPWKKRTTDEFRYRPAYKITESNKPLSNSAVNNRIVVIGASFRDSRDLYQTPLGEMPGAMIILNAIKSLHLFGQITQPRPIVKWILELGLIVLIGWAFARFSSFYGTIVSGIVIIITLLPVSFYFFKYGLWVDFAIPLLGMQFHQFVAQYEESIALEKMPSGQIKGDKNE